MFASFSKSWELVQESWRVLRADKELIVFPIVSLIGLIIVTLVFAVPALVGGLFDSVTQGRGNGVLSFIVAFLFYVVIYTVIFYANTALVGAAMIRLRGGNPTLNDGFRVASEHATSILGYALTAATVGMILRAIAERTGIIGQIVISVLGFAWNVATFLVVPVLVVEGLGPVDAIKRSAALVKSTWGEQLIGNFSIASALGLIGFVITIILGVPLCALSGAANSTALVVGDIALMVVVWLTIGIVSSTLQGIFTAALYRYATEGTTGGFFDDGLVKGAFRHK